MAPTKVLADLGNRLACSKPTMVTRSKRTVEFSKRKAENLSPPKGKNTKRCAFKDVTNNANAKPTLVGKKTSFTTVTKKATVISTKTAEQKENTNNKQRQIIKITSNVEVKNPVLVNVKTKQVVKNIENIPSIVTQVKKNNVISPPKYERKEYDSIQEVTLSGAKYRNKFRRSLENVPLEKSDESSLYASALESVSSPDDSIAILTPVKKRTSCGTTDGPPPGVVDFDKENINDPMQLSHYAMHIFRYMREREPLFKVDDYMSRQVLISKRMRALLVDWMVEVQENFELNHETLYLAVKLTDMYLNKVTVMKEMLQLVAAAAIFLACKYDERMPPLIDDFLYISENAFTRDDLLNMEVHVLTVVGFDLGIPLSYRFLRRYARCSKATMPILTLARYVLELSLMDYQFIFESESKMACAALYLALKMMKVSGWTKTLEYYSDYKLEEFQHLAVVLNKMLHKKPLEELKNVRNKYSHKIFFEVAKTPLIEDSEL